MMLGALLTEAITESRAIAVPEEVFLQKSSAVHQELIDSTGGSTSPSVAMKLSSQFEGSFGHLSHFITELLIDHVQNLN
jgi:hypothetical protein